MDRRLFRTISIALLTSVCLSGPLTAVSAVDKDTLPDADAGECYAKVSVPAVYKTEPVEAVLREASEKIAITPAKFVTAQERVMVRESSTKLVAIQPVYDIIEEKVVVAPASRSWVRPDLDSEMPASKGMLADLADVGIDIATVSAGQCFYEHYKAGETKTTDEKLLIADATEELSVVPAEFAESEKQVLVKAASRRLVAVPVVFENVTEKVVIEPAHSVWEKGRGLIERIDNTTGEIMCRVSVPARYQTINKQKVKTPATITSQMIPAKFDAVKVQTLLKEPQAVRKPVPAVYDTVKLTAKVTDGKTTWLTIRKGLAAEYGQPTGNVVCHREVPARIQTVKRKVVRTPGRFETVEVPAEYKVVEVEKLAADAAAVKTPVPANTETLIRRIQVSDSSLEWRPVLCQTNITPDIVKQIQTALNGRGYSAGEADGLLGRGTLRALEKFQEDQNLAQGGLTYTSIKALGVKL